MVLHLKAYAKKTPEMKPKNGLHKRCCGHFFSFSLANLVPTSSLIHPVPHHPSTPHQMWITSHPPHIHPPPALLSWHQLRAQFWRMSNKFNTMCVTIVINCHSSGEVDNLLTTCWQNDGWGWTCLPSVENSASASSTSAEASAWPGGGQCATHWEGSGYDMIWLWFCLIMFGFNQIILIYLNLFCLHLDLVS